HKNLISLFLISYLYVSKTADQTGKYFPQDLHFPSVAKELIWLALPILDRLDSESYSQEYLFLKKNYRHQTTSPF
ncbi:unnamed protein product, partial [Rotaria sp. Silwood2]